MSYSLVKTVNFGSSRAGLSTVAWSLNGGSTWFTTGVSESPVGSGIYSASIVFADTFVGQLAWTTGEASGQRFAAEDISPPPGGGGDLTELQAGVDAINASLAASKKLTPGAIVTDTSPTRGGFIIAMADGSDVPSTFIWRNSEAWFDGTGVLSGGKYLISTYTKLTATTARITFSPLLPVVPANGDTLLLA